MVPDKIWIIFGKIIKAYGYEGDDLPTGTLSLINFVYKLAQINPDVSARIDIAGDDKFVGVDMYFQDICMGCYIEAGYLHVYWTPVEDFDNDPHAHAWVCHCYVPGKDRMVGTKQYGEKVLLLKSLLSKIKGKSSRDRFIRVAKAVYGDRSRVIKKLITEE